MKELLEAIEKVRERIRKHGDQLRGNEMLTRYALIDPILRALGWDTEDPTQVVPEFQTDVGRPDYVLIYHEEERERKIGVEAKKYGTSGTVFDDAHKKALPLYQSQGIRYYVITDGDRWVLWDISKPRDEMPHPIIDVRLSQSNPGYAARKLLALWRPAMPKVEEAPTSVGEGEKPPPPPGIPLTGLKGKVARTKLSEGRLYFPDGQMREVKDWKELLVEIAKWALPKLKEQKKLPLGKLIYDNPSQMKKPQKIDGWFVETWMSANECVHHAIRILKEAGIDPVEVKVEGWKR